MREETASILSHEVLTGGYRVVTLNAPNIAPAVRPGQFIHLRVPGHPELLLRRPFSVFKAEKDTLSIMYKDVGKGTHAMTTLKPGEELSLVGPLGNGFPKAKPDTLPIMVAGGYGMAPLYMVARACNRTGVVFVGGRTTSDILCVEEFETLGWEVRVATEDGSLGEQGLVTDLFDPWPADLKSPSPEFFVCGPTGMLKAVGEFCTTTGFTAWLSLDRHMACGVGACLTCVQTVFTEDGSSERVRVCREGPVFECRRIDWQGDNDE